MRKIIVLLALVFALAGMLTTCELDTEPRFVVTFEDTRYQNVVPALYVVRGTGMGDKMPTLPSSESGIIFYGWYDGSTRYDSDTIIGGDIKLTARWSDDVVTVRFVFSQKATNGQVIKPVADVPAEIKAIRGIPLSPLVYPVTPRSRGWQFDDWRVNGEDSARFNAESIVPGDVTLEARWLAKKELTVSFYPGAGVTPIPSIKVYENECIDEWMPPGQTQFPENPALGSNPINPTAFFVAWLDDENRSYNGRTPITRSLTINGKWGLKPYRVNFETDIEKIDSSPAEDYGNVNYNPIVRGAWDDPSKKVIVNTVAYDVPNNTNRWRIIYRIKFNWPADFSTEFFTKYTIRARFYANQQGVEGWKESDPSHAGDFVPDVPAVAKGYSKDGWLWKKDYNGYDEDEFIYFTDPETGEPIIDPETDEPKKEPNPNYGKLKGPEFSRSNDGWGQVSWCLAENWSGEGANAETLLQRYNLDRKGGTIGDDWAPQRGTAEQKAQPAYLIIQTSDAYIGHIEITDIIFYNGIIKEPGDPDDEWEHGAYLDEPRPTAGE
jgi:hypothetical protein